MEVKVIGSGDAFGSGGRLQPCFLAVDNKSRFALDFGFTALIGLRKQDIKPNSIDAVLLTHLHGDHCGGIPFLLMDAMLGSRRESPLTIIGPEGIEIHINNLQEILFPGSNIMKPGFTVKYIEITKWHLNYPDIKHLRAKKIVLTHMHETMLAHKDEVAETCAYDGMEIRI